MLPAAIVVGEYAWSRTLGNGAIGLGKTKVTVSKRKVINMKAQLNSLPHELQDASFDSELPGLPS